MIDMAAAVQAALLVVSEKNGDGSPIHFQDAMIGNILRAALPVLRAGWLAELGSDEAIERAKEVLYSRMGFYSEDDLRETARAVLGALTEGQAQT